MYEHITYESILKRMLAQVSAAMDKREGSIIYDALAPAALELQNMYIELDTILKESFADTQSREYLIRRAAERGITPEPATYAILQAEFNKDVPIGARFSLDDLNYIVTEKITSGRFKMECETPGEIGNSRTGTLVPIDYISGLEKAELTEILIPGEDEEDTEHLRNRYYSSLEARAFGGNVQDYKEKTNALPGVGGVKVYPVWNGGGTVKLVIIDSTYSIPSAALLAATQTAIDPEGNQGEGIGFAPIGHKVTVEGVQETTIDIQTQITYQDGWAWADIQPYVEETIDGYFKELTQTWANEDQLIVRISQIETKLLNLPGVIDIGDTKLNNQPQNLILDEKNIPKRGELIG